MREANRVNTAIKIIELYLNGSSGSKGKIMPLSIFLSQYYKANKQMGSKDRKTASNLVYNYFRLGNNLKEEAINTRLLIANFLCETETSPVLEYLLENTGFHDKINVSIEEKINLIKEKYSSFSLNQLFTFVPEFSEGIKAADFYYSFFRQPLLWIRIKKGKESLVIKELEANQIKYFQSEEFPQALSFLNGTSLENLQAKKNGLFEIQDISSQLTGKYFKANSGENWWDCCAASGGKSLLLADSAAGIRILASDTRDNILINLKNRFQQAGIKNFEVLQADLMSMFNIKRPLNFFDGIITDVPCSGSGTWARTPEMLTLFSEKSVLDFQHKQKTITANVLSYLKPGQPLIYITCSVFKAENEEVVNYLANEFNLEIVYSEMILGYSRQSDNLFIARLIKNH